MHDACVGSRGHGRAWQLLAKKVEDVATVVLGARVDMGRFPSLLRDLEGNGQLPSYHDLEVYGWGETNERDEKEAMRERRGG
jgi:hypothetical protein